MGAGGHVLIYGVPEADLKIRMADGTYAEPLDWSEANEPGDDEDDTLYAELGNAEAGDIWGVVSGCFENGIGMEEVAVDSIDKARARWDEHIASGHFKAESEPKLYACRYWD